MESKPILTKLQTLDNAGPVDFVPATSFNTRSPASTPSMSRRGSHNVDFYLDPKKEPKPIGTPTMTKDYTTTPEVNGGIMTPAPRLRRNYAFASLDGIRL